MPDEAGDPPPAKDEPPASSPLRLLAAVSTAWLSVNIALAALAALLWFAPLPTRFSTRPPAPTSTVAPLFIPTDWQTPSSSAMPPNQSPSAATPPPTGAGGGPTPGPTSSPKPTTPTATPAPTATRPAPTATPGNQN